MASNSREGPHGERQPADQGRGAAAAAAADGTRRVGVLSPHNSTETKAILNAVRALGHEPVWVRDANVASWIEDGSVGISPAVDVLINRLLLTKSDTPFEDLQLAALYERTVPVVNPARSVQNALHKYRAGTTLAAAGVPVPDAFFGRSPRTFDQWCDRLGGTDAVHKRTVGTNGRQMTRATPGDDLNPHIEARQSFVQEYLDQPGREPADVRVYVVDGRVVGAMRRHARDGEWRTNVALGGEVEGVTDELGSTPRRLARTAVDALGLDVAGVDLLPIEGDWYVLEVNATAGFKGLFEATGSSPAPAIARIALELAGSEVPARRVESLTSTLDDSVPDCKPPRHERPADPAVIGYTSRVRVTGDRSAESVLAKADTGARRTSLDTSLAGRIGAGPVVGTTAVRTGSRGGSHTRPLVELTLRVEGHWQTVTASITDRSAMAYPVLLGRDVLEGFTVDISRRAEEE